jgi:hypothetical protein
MSTEQDAASKVAQNEPEAKPAAAKPRRQAGPKTARTVTAAKGAGRAGGAGEHAAEAPPTIRPKTKPRPAAGHVNVKRVGHAETEARSTQGGAGLTPGSHGPRRSYTPQTGMPAAAPEPSAHHTAAGTVVAHAAPPAGGRPGGAGSGVAGSGVAGSGGGAGVGAGVGAGQRKASKRAKQAAGAGAGGGSGGGAGVAGAGGMAAGAAATTATALVGPGGVEARGEAAPAPSKARRTAGRVKLNLSYIAPLSVMKISFLVAIALGIAFVVAVYVLWESLNDKAVFTTIDNMIVDLVGENRPESLQILKYVEPSRVMSAAAIVAVVDVIVITVISTLLAVVYNIIAALVGGVHVTLRER